MLIPGFKKCCLLVLQTKEVEDSLNRKLPSLKRAKESMHAVPDFWSLDLWFQTSDSLLAKLDGIHFLGTMVCSTGK